MGVRCWRKVRKRRVKINEKKFLNVLQSVTYKLNLFFSACPPGTYGENCKFLCGCKHGFCDHVTGVCDCSPGYRGKFCDLGKELVITLIFLR